MAEHHLFRKVLAADGDGVAAAPIAQSAGDAVDHKEEHQESRCDGQNPLLLSPVFSGVGAGSALQAQGRDQFFHYAKEEVNQQRQQAGGEGAGQDLIVIHGADAGENQVAQAAAADEGGHGHQANGGDGGDADTSHHDRQRLGDLDFVEHLEPRHPDGGSCLEGVWVDALDAGVGVFDDGRRE